MTHKLLLADDSVTIQRVVELTFSGEDVQVVTVGDGEQAIARIPIELPDIVLADIGMPKRSGYDVAAFVKGRSDLSHIPVLLLAGAFEPVDETRAQQVHSDGVLVKPFEPQQVIARVRDLIESSRATSHQSAGGSPGDRRPRIIGREMERGELHRARTTGACRSPKRRPTNLESRDRSAESKLDDYFDRSMRRLRSSGPTRIATCHPRQIDDELRRPRCPHAREPAGRVFECRAGRAPA